MNINRQSEIPIRLFLPHKLPENVFRILSAFSFWMARHALNPESGFKIVQNRTGTALLRVCTNKFFRTVPRIPAPRLPPRGSLGTGKIFGTVAVLFLGTLCLHVENWECRAKKLRAPCRNFGVQCPCAREWCLGTGTKSDIVQTHQCLID